MPTFFQCFLVRLYWSIKDIFICRISGESIIDVFINIFDCCRGWLDLMLTWPDCVVWLHVRVVEGYLWTVTWLDGRIWTEINVLTSNLIWLGGRIWIEILCRPEILLYVPVFRLTLLYPGGQKLPRKSFRVQFLRDDELGIPKNPYFDPSHNLVASEIFLSLLLKNDPCLKNCTLKLFLVNFWPRNKYYPII